MAPLQFRHEFRLLLTFRINNTYPHNEVGTIWYVLSTDNSRDELAPTQRQITAMAMDDLLMNVEAHCFNLALDDLTPSGAYIKSHYEVKTRCINGSGKEVK